MRGVGGDAEITETAVPTGVSSAGVRRFWTKSKKRKREVDVQAL